MTHPLKSLLLVLALSTAVSACSNRHQTDNRFNINNLANAGFASAGLGSAGYGYTSAQPCGPYPCSAQSYGFQAPHHQGSLALSQAPALRPAYGYGQSLGSYGQQAAYYGQPNRKNRSRMEQPRSYGNKYAMRGRGSALTYESLNAMEAPFATEIAGMTFHLRGRVDSVGEYSFEQDDADFNHRFVGSHLLTMEKQLPNRLTVGAIFSGRHEDILNDDVDYKPRIRGYVGGSWGTLLGGNVQDVVYESTRRLRGAGVNLGKGAREETLAGDGALGRLSKWGGGYQGRFGPTIISAIVDEDAHYDVGVRFQRPIGNKDYRITARHNKGTFTAADGITEIESKAVTGVGEYVYGSTRYDVSGGFEKLETGAISADRWFTSAGFTTKAGLWSLTAEGHYGEIEGQEEISGFAGLKYDLARGMAASVGVDYEDRQINIGGVDFINTKDTRALVGLTYGF